MARHKDIWRMTLGGWPLRNRKRKECAPLEVYNTPERLFIRGTLNYPESQEGREVRIEFLREGNGVATAHAVIDVLQEWIRWNTNAD